MRRLVSRVERLFAVGVLVAGAACTTEKIVYRDKIVEPPTRAVSMAPATSAVTSGTVGATASPAPSVKVMGSNGSPFANASVTFTIASGGGQVSTATVATSAAGLATVGSWTLGNAIGTQTLTASSPSLESVVFTVNAVAGAPARMTIVSGNNQQSAVGSAVQPLVVRVADQFDNPAGGATVAVQVASGGGQLATTSVSTNPQGLASVGGWVLGSTPGANTVTLTSGSAPAVVFTATAAVGGAARLVAASGDGQTGDPGTPLASPLGVRVTDAFGNGVANATVAFTVTGGSGTLSAAQATSNGEGLATANLTLTDAGVAAVTATSASASGAAVTFTASTGPTITGTVTVASDATRATLLRLRGPIATLGRLRGAFAMNAKVAAGSGQSVAAPEERLSAKDAARMIDTRRRLIVSYHPEAFSLPKSAQSYFDGSLRERASTSYYAALADHETDGLLRRREVSPAIAAVRVDVPEGKDLEAVKRVLRQDPRVADVEEDVVMYALDDPPPARWVPRLANQFADLPAFAFAAPSTERYATDPLADLQLWHYRMIDLPRAWRLTTGSSSVRVAIVDTGVRPDHPAVSALLASTGHYDFTDGVTVITSVPQPICGTGTTFSTVRGTAVDAAAPRNVAQDPNDVFRASSTATCWTRSTGGSHGTHVAGTVGSRANDGIGGTGVAWDVQLIAVRVLGIFGGGFTFDIAQGILYAGGLPATYSGATPGFTVQMPAADIMNLSLGSSSPSSVIANAITAASARTLIIAAAGNEGSSSPHYPAAFPEPVSVVALGPDFGLATYTTVGTTVDIAAPGGETSRFWNTAGVLSSTWNFQTGTPNYAFYQGTSMAAPHVAGVAALVKAANPSFTPAQIRARLLNGAIDLGPPGTDNRYGAGLVNAYNSITGTRGPTATTVVRAIDAATGAVAKTVTAGSDGRFSMANLASGSYFIVAGQNEGSDATLGVPGRRLGWYGSSGMGAVAMSGSTVRNVGLSIGTPVEVEPNDATAQANPLAVNAWVSGNLQAPDLRDIYVVRIPVAGTYTFETSGAVGACFAALEVDTQLRLLDQNAIIIDANDDTSFPAASYPGDYCSLISRQLQPGTYFIEVSQVGSDFGSYRLHVRSGS